MNGPKPKVPPKTRVGSAEALGKALREPVNRRTITRWSKLPGCPGRASNGTYCVEDWQAWVDKLGLKGGETTEAQDIKEKRAALGYEREQFEFQKLRGEWIKVDEVATSWRRVAEQIKADLLALRSQLAAQFPSIAAEVEKTAGDTINETLKKMSERYGDQASS